MSFVKNMKKIIKFLYHIVDVVTAADLDAEKRVIDSLVQIWKLKVGHIVIFFQTLSTKSGQDSKVEVQARFWS